MKPTRAWLEYVIEGCIHGWANLEKVFVGNFQQANVLATLMT